jgi:hypothetical protein
MRGQREWPGLEPLLFGGALVAYALGLPIGLEGAASAGAAGEGVGLGAAGAPLALFALRLCAYLPIGDLAARANLASALAGAVAVALVGRLACEVLRSLRSPPLARQPPSLLEPVAAAGAAAVVALSLGQFRAATAAGPSALTVALVAAAWGCVVVLLRAPEEARAGFRLALLAGLSAGVEPVAAPLVWIPAAGLWVWSLRRGTRWPLGAPLLFVAGLGVSLFAVAVTESGPTLGELLGRMWPAGGDRSLSGRLAEVAGPAREAGEELGVVGLLLAAPGLLVLGGRLPLTFAFVVAALAAGLWLPDGVRLAAALLAAPMAVGIVHLADKLGRARLAAATALAVMAAIAPALDGGAARWSRDVRLPTHLMVRALSEVPLRATVDPGTPEMAGLFHYAGALGLRPDITVQQR